MKTVTASGIFCITCLAPCASMSSSQSRPRARLLVPTTTLAQHLQNQLAREGCALVNHDLFAPSPLSHPERAAERRCLAPTLESRVYPRFSVSRLAYSQHQSEGRSEVTTFMPTTVWKGQIAFGLVSFPVKLHAAARSQSVSFHHSNASVGKRSPRRLLARCFTRFAADFPASSLWNLFLRPAPNDAS